MSWTSSPTAELSSEGARLPRVSVRVADGWWLRTRGLIGRPAPRAGEGMLFPRCSSVHTWLMSYPIDIVYLDEALTVTRVRSSVRPWRFSAGGRGARQVLELAEGEAERLRLQPGVRLEVVRRENGSES